MATVGAEAAGQTITATKAQAGGDNKPGSGGAGSKARPCSNKCTPTAQGHVLWCCACIDFFPVVL